MAEEDMQMHCAIVLHSLCAFELASTVSHWLQSTAPSHPTVLSLAIHATTVCHMGCRICTFTTVTRNAVANGGQLHDDCNSTNVTLLGV